MLGRVRALGWYLYSSLRCARAGSLAAYRIAFGAYLLADLYWRLQMPLGLYWYTDSRAEPRSVLWHGDSPHGWVVHRWLFERTGADLQMLLMGAHGLLAALFAGGVATGWVAPLLYLSTISLCGRSDFFNDGSDKLARNLSLINCFLPLSSVWTLGSFVPLTSKPGSEASSCSPRELIADFAICTFKLQLAFMYLAVTANRFYSDAAWMPGEGSAIYYSLGANFAVTELGKVLMEYPLLCYAVAMGTHLHELAIAACCFLAPSLTVALAALLHVGISLMLFIPQFHCLGVISVIPFLAGPSPFAFYAHDSQRLSTPESDVAFDPSIEKWVPPTEASLASASSTKPSRSPLNNQLELRSFRRSKIAWVLLALLTSYMALNFTAVDLRVIPSLDEGDVGQALRFTQGWLMFGSIARRGDWFEVRARWDGGLKAVDVTRGLATGEWLVEDNPPMYPTRLRGPNPRTHYHSWRLERFFSLAAQWSPQVRQRRLLRLAGSLCYALHDHWKAELPHDLTISLPMFVYWIPAFQFSSPSDKPFEYNRYGNSSHEVLCRDIISSPSQQ